MSGQPFADPIASRPSRAADVARGELFQTVFEFAPIGMALLDLDSRALRVNHALCQMLGYTQRDFAGIDSRAIVHPEDIDEDLRLRELMLSGAFPSYQREKRYIHRSGQPLWADVSCSLVHDEDEHPLHFLMQIQDI